MCITVNSCRLKQRHIPSVCTIAVYLSCMLRHFLEMLEGRSVELINANQIDGSEHFTFHTPFLRLHTSDISRVQCTVFSRLHYLYSFFYLDI